MDTMSEDSTIRKIMLGIEDPTDDSDSLTLKDGDIVADWRIRALIGSGGFGNVYRVEHMRSGAIAALKMLTKFDEESKKRFELETEILQAIHASKKNARRYFPAYLGTGNHQIGSQTVPYVVTEFLEPLKLSDKDEKIGKFIEQMCDAVEELHRNGYLHRDIKSLNVMMRRDEDAESVPILIDFGGAIRIKDAENPDVRTRVSMEYGQIKGFGTIYSSAPEQLYGIATVRSDVYALGALISESFCGNIPENWQRIVQKATEPRPENRYQSVAEMRHAIGRRERQSNWMRFTRIACIIGFISSVVTLSIRFYQGFLTRDEAQLSTVETSKVKQGTTQSDDTIAQTIMSSNEIKGPIQRESTAVLPSTPTIEVEFEYSVADGHAVVCWIPKSTSGAIVIPSKLGGYPVTKIEARAFLGCNSIASVEIPNSVMKIGSGAFGGCTSLTSIAIPNSVTKIEDYAFAGCTSLKSIVIPDSVTEIGQRVIEDTPFYENLPNGFIILGNGCLYKFKGLCPSKVVIPDGVTKIGKMAFWGSQSLASITIPNRVTKIEDYAFWGCTSLHEVVVDGEEEIPRIKELIKNSKSKLNVEDLVFVRSNKQSRRALDASNVLCN